LRNGRRGNAGQSVWLKQRRQVAPIEADSKVGDRHAGDNDARTGQHIDMYV